MKEMDPSYFVHADPDYQGVARGSLTASMKEQESFMNLK